MGNMYETELNASNIISKDDNHSNSNIPNRSQMITIPTINVQKTSRKTTDDIR